MKKGIGLNRVSQFRDEYRKIERILSSCPTVSRKLSVATEEFVARQRRVCNGLRQAGFKGSGNHWNAKVLPVDFVVIENTLGKFDTKVVQFNKVPNDCQSLVGKGI
jgi:hypothetical protein